jgi:hypothetical protein
VSWEEHEIAAKTLAFSRAIRIARALYINVRAWSYPPRLFIKQKAICCFILH